MVIVPGWIDDRRERLVPVDVSVRIRTPNCEQRATVTDLSVSGLGITWCPSLPAGSKVVVELPNNRELEAEVIWSHGSTIGARLMAPLDHDDAIFMKILHWRRAARLGER